MAYIRTLPGIRENKVKEILAKTHVYAVPEFTHLEVLLIEDILEEWLEQHKDLTK